MAIHVRDLISQKEAANCAIQECGAWSLTSVLLSAPGLR